MSILDMSISGAVMIFVIIMLRALMINKLPKETFMVLWGVTLARLLIPYSISSALSVYSLIGRLTKLCGAVSIQAVEAIHIQGTSAMDFVGEMPTAMADEVAKYLIDPWQMVWLAGVAILALFFSVSYVKFRREFSESLPVENEVVSDWLGKHIIRRGIAVRYSDKVSAPLTFGVLHPVILLPKTLDWSDNVYTKCVPFKEGGIENPDFMQDKKQKAIISVRDIDFILEHEFVHIVRFDAVTKMVLTAALCIHWFNPLVWAMYILANRDMELLCDEAVVHRFGEDLKSVYANILIRMEEIKSGFTPLCNNFSKNAIEERIVSIMKIKKYTLSVIIAAAILVASVLTVFATSAADTSVGAEVAYTDADNRGTFMKYLEKKTEVDFMKEDNIESAHAEITYNEPADSYSIELSLVSKEAVSEERVCRYYDILSKTYDSAKIFINGTERVQYGDEMQEEQTLAGEANVTHEEGSGNLEKGYSREELAEYASFGLVIKNGSFYYKDKKVRYFADEFDVAGGVATRHVYMSEVGNVDVHTVRQATQNADGSINPAGKIIALEIEEYALGDSIISDERYTESEAVTIQSTADVQEIVCSEEPIQTSEAVAIQSTENAQEIACSEEPIQTSGAYAVQSNDTGEDFMKMFSEKGKYGQFGISFKRNEVYGNIYYKGKLVNVLIDRSPDGGYFSVRSTDKGGINLKTVYDADGTLTGVEIVDDEQGW